MLNSPQVIIRNEQGKPYMRVFTEQALNQA